MGSSLRPITDVQNALRLSSCSSSTLSSAVTYPSDAQINEYSEAVTQQSNASIDSKQVNSVTTPVNPATSATAIKANY